VARDLVEKLKMKTKLQRKNENGRGHAKRREEKRGQGGRQTPHSFGKSAGGGKIPKRSRGAGANGTEATEVYPKATDQKGES